MKAFIKLFLIISVSSLLTLCACATERGGFEKSDITLTLLNGEHYVVNGGNKVRVENGKAEFDITLEKGYNISGSSEAEFEISENNGWNKILTFTNVRYSNSVQLETGPVSTFHVKTEFDKTLGYVSVQCALGTDEAGDWYEGDSVVFTAKPNTGYYFTGWSKDGYIKDGGQFLSGNDSIILSADPGAIYANFRALADDGNCILYDLGDGNKLLQDCSALIAHHPKANTFTERDLSENGFPADKRSKMLTGWRTPDGEYIDLGSRAAVSPENLLILEAVYKDYSCESLFAVENGKITDYSGSEEEVVIPRKIGETEITEIGANSFEGCAAKAVFIPSSVEAVEPDAFSNCASLKEIYMSDNINSIGNTCFRGCANLTTVHVNAFLEPVYIRTDYAAKADALNSLALCKGKKLIVTGGSSVTYGYKATKINEMIAGYSAFNFGLTAGQNATAWYDILSDYLGKDDIYLHAPELYTEAVYAYTSDSCLTGRSEPKLVKFIFYVAESDLSYVSNLTVNDYSNFFDSFNEYTKEKMSAIKNNQSLLYTDYCNLFDYYGCISDGLVNGGRKNYAWETNGLFNFDAVPDTAFDDAGKEIYTPLAEKGVKVFFTFAPLNETNLLRTYSEWELESACAAYTQRVKSRLEGFPVTVLSGQYESVYKSEKFANSDYHVGSQQSYLHTEKVMEVLKAHLG